MDMSKIKMNDNLSFRMVRKSSVRDIMMQFRFDRYVFSFPFSSSILISSLIPPLALEK